VSTDTIKRHIITEKIWTAELCSVFG